MTEERLQKILASAGLGSRRSCEELIRSGRATVNGRPVALGTRADPARDVIRVDGERVRSAEAPVYIALHKPAGVLTSLKSQGGMATVRDLVDLPQRVYPVGRLDADSEGLVLLTNDGEAAHHLTHPRFGHDREYRVLLDRAPDREQIEAWRAGVVLPDGAKTRGAEVWLQKAEGRGAWMGVILREGRKRQIRETARTLGLRVRRLVRVRIDGLRLGSLAPGEWRLLSGDEVRTLRGEGEGEAGGRRKTPARAKRRSNGKR
jgi:23S rRNA pseudouridine2605 synthase